MKVNTKKAKTVFMGKLVILLIGIFILSSAFTACRKKDNDKSFVSTYEDNADNTDKNSTGEEENSADNDPNNDSTEEEDTLAANGEKNNSTDEETVDNSTGDNNNSSTYEDMKQFYTGEDGQPRVPYWFPNDLLTWEPEQDAELIYNISQIPLVKRVDVEKLDVNHSSQSKDAKVMAISIMNSSTSNNPSQGSNKFMGSANMFSYWQYVDILVYWGGSAGEGIIVPPGADVTDAGHKNGVPVLGTVFFPMGVHGGKLEWLDQTLTKNSDGTFPVADKLIEVARTMKFDGWFLNQETEGTTKKHADLMKEMIQYMKEKAPELHIVWYDSMTEEGDLHWQNALNDKNDGYLINEKKEKLADTMFLNFWWTNNGFAEMELLKASKEKAEQIGLDEYDLYAGIDVQGGGTGTPIRWELYTDENNTPYTSLGLYCPSWTYFSANGNPSLFHQKESSFWVNETGNPMQQTVSTGTKWRGISTYIIEKSPITSIPFVTNFSMGHGKAYYSDGNKVSSEEWNNRSLQDIQPTYRYVIENGGNNSLKAQMDYDTVFNGGSSIQLKGKLEENTASVMNLFDLDVTIEDKTNITLIIKNSVSIKPELILTFEDNSKIVLNREDSQGEEWVHYYYNLGAHENKTLKNISLQITSNQSVNEAMINIGGFYMINGDQSAAEVEKAEVIGTYSKDSIIGGIRVDFGTKEEDINHYEIYRVTDSGKILVGATNNPNYYIGDLLRNGKEEETIFEVTAISKTDYAPQEKHFP